jgi:uncharacterized protein (DUF1697 family)
VPVVRALVVLLRGVNVGGHRTFRPSVLAKELSDHDVVNIGAAGTFVVHRPGPRGKLRDAVLRKLSFDAEVMFCNGADLLRLERDNPFGTEPPYADRVRFVSFLSRAVRSSPTLPLSLPAGDDWLVRVVALRGRLAIGEYRRHMRTIGYLGQIDRLLGVRATTRSWNTVAAVTRALKVHEND